MLMATYTFESIIKDIKNKVYHPVYFLHGEEPYFIDKGKTEVVGEVPRSCLVIDFEKCPDSIKTMCKFIDSERK